MAKIVIDGVRTGVDKTIVHIILVEKQEVDGAEQDVPIGEAFVDLPVGTKMANAKKVINSVAKEVMKRHKEAKEFKGALEKETFLEVE